MSTELIITIIIAVVGWGIAIWQIVANRMDNFKQRKLEAYKTFLVSLSTVCVKIEQSHEPTTDDSFFNHTCMELIGNQEERNQSLVELNTCIANFVRERVDILRTFKAEISSLRLIASEEVLSLTTTLQELGDIICGEYEQELCRTHKEGVNTYNKLVAILNNGKRQQYLQLKDSIESQMRKELVNNRSNNKQTS